MDANYTLAATYAAFPALLVGQNAGILDLRGAERRRAAVLDLRENQLLQREEYLRRYQERLDTFHRELRQREEQIQQWEEGGEEEEEEDPADGDGGQQEGGGGGIPTWKDMTQEQRSDLFKQILEAQAESEAAAEEPYLCAICSEHRREVGVLPCGHYSACDRCAGRLDEARQQRKRCCPTCGQEYTTQTSG